VSDEKCEYAINGLGDTIHVWEKSSQALQSSIASLVDTLEKK
jgi:hypothetical protein